MGMYLCCANGNSSGAGYLFLFVVSLDAGYLLSGRGATIWTRYYNGEDSNEEWLTYWSKNDPGTPQGRWGLWIPNPMKNGWFIAPLSVARCHSSNWLTTAFAIDTSGQVEFSGNRQYMGAPGTPLEGQVQPWLPPGSVALTDQEPYALSLSGGRSGWNNFPVPRVQYPCEWK